MSGPQLPVRRGNREINRSRVFDRPRGDAATAVGTQSVSPDGAAVVERARHRAETKGSTQLGTVRRAGWIVFGIQLVGFVIWSTVVWQRFALTYDFWLVYHASYKVNHSGIAGAWQVMTQYFDAVILWFFALLIRLPSHGLTLLWVQDLAVVGVGLVAFLWVCEMLERRPLRTGIPAHWLAVLALVFLVGNPWIFKTVAFDFHLEVFGALFIVLAARDLQQGRFRRALVWIAATLSCGFVAATYVGGLALSALVAGRRRQRLIGGGLLALGIASVIVLTSAGGSTAVVGYYSYLVGAHSGTHLSLGHLFLDLIAHPAKALKTLWANHVDVVDVLAPVGILGLVWGWGFGVALVVLLANTLQTNPVLIAPSFQSLPVFVFVAVGTVMLLSRISQARFELPVARVRLHDRGSPVIWAVCGFLALLTVRWAITYTPGIADWFLSVAPGSAAVLRSVEAKIPQNAEVIVSQGVVGRFSDRVHVEPIMDPGELIPLETRTVWLVIMPRPGLDPAPASVQIAIVSEVESEGARLVAHSHGVWAFNWSPPSGVHTLLVPAAGNPVHGFES